MSTRQVTPKGPFRCDVAVPPDKSLTHRAVLLAAMGRGESLIRNPLESADTLATMAAVGALGASLERLPEGLRVQGTGGAWLTPAGEIDALNAGTAARLLLGALAGGPAEVTLTGDASLRSRPMGRVIEPLRAMGADVQELGEAGRMPVRVRGAALHGQRHVIGVASAQTKSALLLAGLAALGRTEVHLPAKTRDHTEILLAAMGAPLTRMPGPAGESVAVEGPFTLPALGTFEVPGDPSSAAFLAAAAVVTGGEARLRGVLLNPRRTGFFTALREMGAFVEASHLGRGGEAVGDLTVWGEITSPIEIGASRVPDLIDELPLLAVLMALAPGTSRVSGAAELRLKESDRIAAMAEGLCAMGADVRERPDGWDIPGPSRLHGAPLDGRGDHRVGMALAVAALAARGTSLISDAAQDVSFPGFFGVLGQDGGLSA